MSFKGVKSDQIKPAAVQDMKATTKMSWEW